jgi:hypothetical protein
MLYSPNNLQTFANRRTKMRTIAKPNIWNIFFFALSLHHEFDDDHTYPQRTVPINNWCSDLRRTLCRDVAEQSSKSSTAAGTIG